MSATKTDYQVASLAAGFTLGFGFLTCWEAIKQTKRNKNPLRSLYIYMIWGEIAANLVLGIIAWLFLDGVVPASIPTFFFILVLWVFEIQLLMQIIINRIAVIAESQHSIRWIRWGTVGIISAINVAVFCIFIPAHITPPVNDLVVQINHYWDRASKFLILTVDASLNWYFLREVKKRLVEYHGLTKYKPLVNFNTKLMILSIAMDAMLIGLMWLPNQVVFIQFHPVTYLVKLNIEMSMSSLILKLARGEKNDIHFNSLSYSHGPRDPTQTIEEGKNEREVALTTFTKTKVQSELSDSDSETTQPGVGEIHRKIDYHVTISTPADGKASESSGRGSSAGFQRLDDEISLANNAGHPQAISQYT